MGAFGGQCGAYAEGSVYNTQTATHTPSSVNITGDAVATLADDEDATGAYAVDFGSVTVSGDAEGTGTGAIAFDAGAITLKGHAIGGTVGVHAEGAGTRITVQGDVSASGAVDAFAVQCVDGASVAIGGSAYSGDGGVFVRYGSEVTIEGSIFPANLARTIALEGWTVSVDDFATPTTKPGYTTYTKTYYYNDLHMEYTSNLWVRGGSSGLPFSIDIEEMVFPAGAASASGEDNYIFIVGSGLYALYDYALSLDGGATKFGELYSAIGVFNGNGVIITFDLPPNTGGSDITRTISLFVNGADTGTSLTIVQRGMDYEDVMNSAANLTWFAICGLNTSPDNVLDPLVLPTEWDFGTQIAWESQNPAVVVEDDGTGSIHFVEDPVNDFTVGDVVATITKGGASATVAFSIAVPTLTTVTVGTGGDFATLDQALAIIADNRYYSIKLLENITYATPVTISLKNIVFDLNGHDLVFDAGLTLRGSRVSYANGGHLIVRQDLVLLTASVGGGGPDMTTYESRGSFSSFESTGKGNIGLSGVCNRATIGNVTMNGGGCIEIYSSVLTVKGDIYIENNAGDVALYAGSNGKLEVFGTMTVTEGWVAEFTDGGQMVAHRMLIFNNDTFFRDANVGTKKVEYTYRDVSVGSYEGYPAYFFYGPKSWPFAIVMNIGPFLAVSDMAGVPAIATVYVPLALDYDVTPAWATNTGATWVVKSPGATDAVITSGAYDGDWALLSTLPGTVVLTATIKDGLAPGTDFVKDFVVQIFPEIVSIEVRTPPDKLTYFLGEALDLAGMEVYAQYYDNSERLVTEYETSPKHGDKFNQLGTIEVEVAYDKEWSFWNRPVVAFDVEVVLEPDMPGVCQIVETGKSYEHFEDALAAHESGQTIRLLTDIHYFKGILLEGEVLNLDLNGHDMIVEVAYITYDDWFGIAAYEGGQLNLVGTGGGKLNVLAGDTGIYANGISSSVTVDSIAAIGNYGSCGVAVNYGGSATARGNIAGYNYGIFVLNGGKVSAKGNVAGKDYGVYAEGRGSVAGGSLGEIDVSGSISAATYGVYADLQGADRAVVHVGGDIKPLTTSLSYGINQYNGAPGNFVATVDGSISADWTAVETRGGTIDVVGGATSKGSGVMVYDGAQVTLGGLTSHNDYSYVSTSYNSVYRWFDKEEFITPTTKEGFLTYTDGANSVWVMVPGAFIPVTGITGVPDSAGAGSPLALTGKVESAYATNRTIAWSIKDAGSTGAALSGNVLLAPSAGTVVVTATVADGVAIGTAYTQDFAIVVAAGGTPILYEVHNAEELNGVFSMDDEWGYYLDNEKTIWYGFYEYVAEHSLNWSKPMPDNYPCIVKLMDNIVFFDDYYDDVLGLVHYDGEVPQPAVTDKLVTIDLNGHHMDLAGMYVHNSAVTVEGDIYIIWSPGIWMSDACDFVVNGSIYGSGTNLSMLCLIGTGCSVAVKGDVVSNGEGIRVDGNNATVTVNGSITANTSAIVTNGGNDTVTVGGDVHGGSTGINATGISSVTVSGNLTSGGAYITLSSDSGGSKTFAKEDKSPVSSKPGYDEYAFEDAIVWVKSSLSEAALTGIAVRTNPTSYVGEDVEFAFSLIDAENVLDIKLIFEIDGSMMVWKDIETLASFDNVRGVYWTLAGSNTWQGTVTIGIPSPDGIGFTSEAPVDIAKFIFAPVKAGNATLTLTGFTVVAYVGDTAQYVESTIEAGTATTKIDKHYSKYDLDRDGTVDALDLGIMLLYCGFDKDSPSWGTLVKVNDSWGKGVTASMCDVNGDGVIDMLDLLDLLIHYTI
ncbi:MAG: dockerin type I domain-containing protein [Clostridiales bacterium]|nr:dockerin type I domain-containing protein [Clostridiales bacterium]